MSINDIGIEIFNNRSIIIENIIEKSHENGIKIIGDNKNTRSMPSVWKNRIFSCGYNGILCMGKFCEPDIRGNIIESNRKAGIKLSDNSTAHIGGTSKDDIKTLPSYYQPSIIPTGGMSITMQKDGTAGGPGDMDTSKLIHKT